MTRWSEQHRGTGSISGGGVSGGILLSEVGFHFYDASRKKGATVLPD
jgi:hypothetical protein